MSSDRSVILQKAGWDAQIIAARYFNFCVTLYVLLGFCEEQMCSDHELILIRARNDNNCLRRNPAVEPTNYSKANTMANAARVIERDK